MSLAPNEPNFWSVNGQANVYSALQWAAGRHAGRTNEHLLTGTEWGRRPSDGPQASDWRGRRVRAGAALRCVARRSQQLTMGEIQC